MAGWQERGFILAGGKRLEFACHGPPPDAAPTLVMLHEGLGCVALWRDLPERLAKATGLGVLAFSRSGYGKSDPADLPRPLDYMTREAVEILPTVLNAMNISRAVLLGHSDGGTIAALHAGNVADRRVRGLVLIAPHFFTETHGLSEIARITKHYKGSDLPRRMGKYHDDPDATFHGWSNAWLHPGFRGWDVSDALDYIRIPVLAIQGRDDPYGTLAQIAEIESRCQSPVETLILDACGHAPHIEHPQDTISAVSGFIARLMRIDTGTGRTDGP